MGLKKRGDTWHLRVMIDGRRIERSTGFSDLKSARRRASEIENELRAGVLGWRKDCPTFESWWKTYSGAYGALKRPGTQTRDAGTMTHALAFFGTNTRLDAIKPSTCEKYLQHRRTSLTANPGRKVQTPIAEGTVQRERRLLQAVFQRAVADGHLERNPWKDVESKPDVVRVRLLTAGDEVKLMAVLAPRFQRFVAFLLQTGLRLEEVRGIDPKTDIHDGQVRVTGKFQKKRDVPLTKAARQALDDQIAAEGKLWTQNPQRLREVLAEGAQRAGIPHLSPHDLRHTFGHRWLVAGGDVYVLSRLLGHASVSVTEQHYAHLLKEDLAAKMAAVMEPAQPMPPPSPPG